MKVLFIIPDLRFGGAEILSRDLAIGFKNKGVEIEIFLLKSHHNEITDEINKHKIKIYSTDANRFIDIKNLKWLLKNCGKYDILHGHLWYSQYYLYILKKLNKKIKTITTEHSSSNKRRKYRSFKLIEKFVYNSFDEVVAINDEVKKTVEIWQPSLMNRVKVVNNGINIEKFKQALEEKKIKNNKIKILMVASFRQEKDHDTLLRAFKLLDEKFQLILVGSGEREEAIKKLSKDMKIDERVVFLGNRLDVNRVMKSCDIFVLTSKWEGFGLVIVEAMAAGIPVIGSRVTGLSSVIGDAGLLFEVGNYEELAQKINYISENSKIKTELKNKGLKRSEKYNIEVCIKSYLELYYDSLGE